MGDAMSDESINLDWLVPHINSLCTALDIHPDSINGGVIRAAFVAAVARAPQAGWEQKYHEAVKILEALYGAIEPQDMGHYDQIDAMQAADKFLNEYHEMDPWPVDDTRYAAAPSPIMGEKE